MNKTVSSLNRLGVFFFYSAFVSNASAQRTYVTDANEWIFSAAVVEAGTTDLEPIVRFTAFFNDATLIHFDSKKTIGLFTGLAVRNVGFITKLDPDLRIKERSYSLGVPLALKLGNLKKEIFVAAGGEMELMFAWKRKIFMNNEKSKYTEWFADEVNLLNPSSFLELHFNKHLFIRLKYYWFDFLDYQEGGLQLPDEEILPDYLRHSKMFYVAICSSTYKKELGEKKDDVQRTNADAYFMEGE